MKTYTHVRDLLKDSGREPVTVSAQATAVECASVMVDKHVDCVLVMSDGKLVGLVTAHDLVSGLAGKREQLVNIPASELMTRELVTTSEDTELENVESQMKSEHIHYLPVLADGKVVGVVTLADVLALHLNREQSVESELENYIYGVTRPRF